MVVPKGWTLPVRDILTYKGAGFLVPVAGTISLMPGTSSNPAFRRAGSVRTRVVLPTWHIPVSTTTGIVSKACTIRGVISRGW